MRLIIKLFFGLLIFCQENVRAQCFYERFEDACTTQENATWIDQCGSGWTQSHGSPNMVYYYSHPPGWAKPVFGHYAFMYSHKASGVLEGEGMFHPREFKANTTYEIILRLAAYGGGGEIKVFAVNGLTKSTNTGLPNVAETNKELIGTFSGSTDWDDVPFTFTPTKDFNQIWIYPQATSGVQYNAQVMYISVCPACDGEIIYKTGTVPSGTSKSGTIKAGSSAGTGGSGTVTASIGLITSFVSAQAIELLPSFSSTSTATSSFTASIEPCNPFYETFSVYPSTADSVRIALPINGTGIYNAGQRKLETLTVSSEEDHLVGGAVGNTAYPTIGSGTVTVNGPIDANSKIIVFDMDGRQRLIQTVQTQVQQVVLDLGDFKSGSYVVTFWSRSKRVSKKILIQK